MRDEHTGLSFSLHFGQRQILTANVRCHFLFKRNTPQLAAAGIKGMRIQFRLRSAWPGSNFMRQRLGCPAACGVGALPPFHLTIEKSSLDLASAT